MTEEVPEEVKEELDWENLTEEEKETIQEIHEKRADGWNTGKFKFSQYGGENGLKWFTGWMLTEFIEKYRDALGGREILALEMFREYLQDEFIGTDYLNPLINIQPETLEKLYMQADVENILTEEERQQLEKILKED